jgi:uroporphyrinogen decarboxylase
MNMQAWKNRIIQSKEKIAIPILTHPGIEMIGATVRDAASRGEIQFRAIEALTKKFPTGAATMMMDLSVEAEAFGSEVHFSENEIPSITGRLLTDASSIEKFTVPGLSQGRLPEYLKAAELCAKNIMDRPVLAGCIGPFSLTGRLYGLTEIFTEILINPALIHTLLQRCTRFLTDYCFAFKETGVGGVVMAEPAAGMLSPDMCREFSSVYVKQIVDAVQDDQFLVVLHNCGNTDPLLAEMQMTVAAGLHFGNKCNIVAALEFLKKDRLVMGNLDPVGIFKMETPEEVSRKTRELLKVTADYPNFVLSSGCDIPPQTPLKNIAAFFEAMNQF